MNEVSTISDVKAIFDLERPVFEGNLLKLDKIELLQNNKLIKLPLARILFHGTLVENLPSIIENGFDLKYLSMPGQIGRGFYFSTLITQAIYYQLKKSYTGDEKKFTLLACKVLTGKHKLMKDRYSINIPKTPDFDSHCVTYKDEFGEGYEFCIYDTKRIIPFCLLHMTVTETKKTSSKVARSKQICAGIRKNGNACSFKAIHAGFCKVHSDQHPCLKL